mgnify:FL=1|jgi:hypothetical protein
MFKTILALLIAAFGNVTGVRKDGLTNLARGLSLQATNDEEAKAIVDKLTEAQVIEFCKGYRQDVDKEVSESNKTLEANIRKKFNIKDDIKTEPCGDDDKKGDIAAIVKAAVDAALAPMKETIDGFKAKEVGKTRLQALEDALKECKDENFKAQTLKDFGRMSFASDDDFNEYLSGKTADVKTANQRVADDALRGGGAPLFSQKEAETGVSKGVSEFIKSQSPEGNAFAGKTV